MHRWILVILTLLAVACSTRDRPAEPDCSNPASAVDSLLAWQHPSSFDLDRAVTCVEPVPGRDARKLAVQLKQVLDARGTYVPVDSLPIEPDYVDEEGESVVTAVEGDLPVVVRRGADGTWRYTRETLLAAPRAYSETFSSTSRWLLNNLPPVFSQDIGGLFLWQLVFGAVLFALAWLTGLLVRALLRDRVVKVVQRLGLQLDQDIYARTNRPLMYVASLWVLLWGLPQLQLPIDISRFAVGAVALGFRLAIIWTLLGFLDVVVDVSKRFAENTESKLDDQLIPLIRQAVRMLIGLFGVLIVLEALGVDVWKLLAGVSIGSLVFALAAQDTVANMFGSINVFIDRPFQIGDWVIIDGVEGVVEEVGFRSTRIRTFYNSQVTIPNSTLTNANVDNMGRRGRRRVKLTLGLTYDTPPDKLQAYTQGVQAILAAHEGVEKTYEVHVYNLSASSIDIMVYYHLAVPGWHEELATRAQNILEFIRLAHELGVSFAFPSTSVYLESTPEQPLSPHATSPIAELERIATAFGPGGELARPEGPAFSRSFAAHTLDKSG